MPSPTLATNALTTLQALYDAGLPSAKADHLTRLVNQASGMIEGFLDRKLRRRQYTTSAPLVMEGSGRVDLWLPQWPIVAVERVQIDGSTVDDWTRSEEGDELGYLYREAGWPRVVGTRSDLTGDSDPSFLRRQISVAYTCGYDLPNEAAGDPASPLPSEIEGACIRLVQQIYSAPTSSIVRERTPGGYEVQFRSPGDTHLPPEIEAMIRHHKRGSV